MLLKMFIVMIRENIYMTLLETKSKKKYLEIKDNENNE